MIAAEAKAMSLRAKLHDEIKTMILESVKQGGRETRFVLTQHRLAIDTVLNRETEEEHAVSDVLLALESAGYVISFDDNVVIIRW